MTSDNSGAPLFPHPARPPSLGWYGRLLKEIDQPELFDLLNDLGKKRDISAEHPREVAKLEAMANVARKDPGKTIQRGSGLRGNYRWQTKYGLEAEGPGPQADLNKACSPQTNQWVESAPRQDPD